MRFLSSLRAAAFCFALPLSAFAAGTITGTITNGTTGKPSANDTVTLIRLAQGMQEATHTTTDSKGQYSLVVPEDGIHLVRATHEGANYFKPAPPGTQNVDIDVYAVAAKVPGVKLEADVMRVQTEADAKSLKVVQHFFLKNDSTPPKTQFSDATFDFTLPEGAAIEGAAAQGPGGMTVQSQPVPLKAKNHYTFNFAVRPGGQTQFQVSYHVPYTGTVKMAPLTAMAADNVVVMLPKAMKFDGGSTPWVSVTEETDAQTYVARNIAANDAAAFTVSGQGQLPRQTTTANDASQQDQGNGPPTGTPATGANANADPGSNTAPNRPGGGLGTPIDTPDPLSKYKWWIIAGIGLALAGGAGFLLSRPQNTSTATTAPTSPAVAGAIATPHVPQTSNILHALRDELFTLESDRLTGRITPEQYAKVKPALETVLQNALERSGSKA
ncbi:MAG: hypothetical protein ACRYGF_01130 [Janthinobacterium lividum]